MDFNRELWNRCVDFHGHSCPGLAIGFAVAKAASEKIDLKFSEDEEIVCITENDACCVDAVQYITGCTAGKGNLIFKDNGKMAFSFINRKTGSSVRLIMKNMNHDLSREEFTEHLLDRPVDEIFETTKLRHEIPEYAKHHENKNCSVCNESTANHRLREISGKLYCRDCE